jgi:hypothetical protein
MFIILVLCSVLSRADALAGLFVPLSGGKGPEAKDKRQRVVPPVAAGVFLAGFVMIARVIRNARIATV